MGRVDYAVSKKNLRGTSSPDKRGRNSPSNKISEDLIILVQNFLNNFPKFSSHYSESAKLYFAPDLNIQKLLELFREKYPAKNISYFLFRREVGKYNVGFYVPKKDTCSHCDKYKHSGGDEDDRMLHLRRAEDARSLLRSKEKESEENQEILCITFDMQKTQPLPYLNTSVAFYKRQMWLYNLGISDRGIKKSTMCVWTEVEGRKGSNEVASSLYKFLLGKDLTRLKEIHSFSDACGGQNRNKNILAFMKFFCDKYNIRWTHGYLESGHSFLPNDTDFGKIEKSKNKNCIGIYTSDQYFDIMRRNNFKVEEMRGNFFEFSALSQFFSLKCTNTKGERFNWLKLKWFQVSAEQNFVAYKESCNQLEEIKMIAFNRSIPADSFCPSPLYQDLIPLKFVKYKDLMSLLPYIPSVYTPLYKSLPHSNDKDEDDIEEL